jgi:hypothetical protein
MNLDRKSFMIGLMVGMVVMLILCVALLLGGAWIISRHDQTAKISPAPALCPVAGDSVVTEALVPIPKREHSVPGIGRRGERHDRSFGQKRDCQVRDKNRGLLEITA